MPALTALASKSSQDTTAAVAAPTSELEAARERVAPLLAAFEATYGRPVTVSGPASERAAGVVRAVASIQAARR